MSTVRLAPPASPGGAAGRLALLGVPSAQAAAMGAALDEVMSGCVLELARSAIPNGAGLVVVAGADQFDRDDLAREIGRDLGAQLQRLSGLGHCWMAEAPERAASVLIQFWSSLEQRSPSGRTDEVPPIEGRG